MARSVGNLTMICWLQWALADAELHAGRRLEEIIADLEDVLAMDPEPGDWQLVSDQIIRLRSLRGEDVSERLERQQAVLRELSDPQTELGATWVRSLVALVEGRASEAARLAAEFGEARLGYGDLMLGVLYAGIGRDAKLAAELLPKGDALPRGSGLNEGLQAAASAVVQRSRGAWTKRSPGSAGLASGFKPVGSRFLLAMLALAMASTLPPDVPEVREASIEALDILDGMGASALSSQLRERLGALAPAG